jgi:hypothetical protein
MDDRFAVDIIEVRQDPRLEFGLRGDPNVAQHPAPRRRSMKFWCGISHAGRVIPNDLPSMKLDAGLPNCEVR